MDTSQHEDVLCIKGIGRTLRPYETPGKVNIHRGSANVAGTPQALIPTHRWDGAKGADLAGRDATSASLNTPSERGQAVGLSLRSVQGMCWKQCPTGAGYVRRAKDVSGVELSPYLFLGQACDLYHLLSPCSAVHDAQVAFRYAQALRE